MKKAPVLQQRGKDGACKGIIRLCRCCMPLLGNKTGERAYRRSAFRRIGPASEDIRRVLFVAAGAWLPFPFPATGKIIPFPAASIQGTWQGAACRGIGIISPIIRRWSGYCAMPAAGSFGAQAWHRLHSEPCPAWGGKRWWRAAGCLPCRRSGGCPGWTGPECAS